MNTNLNYLCKITREKINKYNNVRKSIISK